jgi:predicted transglutaminase-like cysteine proteinase
MSPAPNNTGRAVILQVRVARAAALALAAAVWIGMAAGSVDARGRGKPIPLFGPDLIEAALESARVPAPPQFFTINEVLARKDAEAAKAKAPVRLASLEQISLRGAIDDVSPTRSMPSETEPFGLLSFRAPEGLLWVKWRSLAKDLQRDAETLKHCRSDADGCPRAARKFETIVAGAKTRDGLERLEYVNHAVNSAVRYMSDYQQHGVADLWSSALATFATGLGDCEDYAIAKYAALIEAGVPADELRIVLVRHLGLGEAHAVLAARSQDGWFVLDNLRTSVVEDRAIKNFLPLFVLDQHGVSLLAGSFARNSRGKPLSRSMFEIGASSQRSAEPAGDSTHGQQNNDEYFP